MPRVSEQTSCENPKVSVAMITYNHEKFIAQAIESVLMQETDFPVELVIGEDCSTDGTRRIVQEYAAKYPNVIRPFLPEKNLGMNKNARAVQAVCRGEYVAILDGDDYWIASDKLQKQVAFMDTNPDYSMCGSMVQEESECPKGNNIQISIWPSSLKPPCLSLIDIVRHHPFHTSTALFRKGIVQLPIWFDQVLIADACIYLLHAEKGPLGFMHEVTSVYRRHSGGIWTGKKAILKYKAIRTSLDLFNTHFCGRFENDFCRREYDALNDLFWENGSNRETILLLMESVPRLARFMPLGLVKLGIKFCLGVKVMEAWNRFTIFIAIRTRLRRLASRFKK